MSSFEKAVRGGTKVKLAPPKAKYVSQLLVATQTGEAGVAEVFRTLTPRLRDSTWTVAFKALILVHMMIREGSPEVTLSYLAVAPKNRLAINSFTDVQTQGSNIRRYSQYMLVRAQAYAAAKYDFVISGGSRLSKLSVDKGLLRETEAVQEQIKALLKCDLMTNDTENEISVAAFRLLTRDLLDLYDAENKAVMNVLGRYFEMSKPDAERSVRIYKRFCKQTEFVVEYLGVARNHSHVTQVDIPKINHAPTSLAKSLQDYLDDKDFDINRRQYLAQQDAKRTGKPLQKVEAPKSQPSSSAAPVAAAAAAPQQPKAATQSAAAAKPAGPAPDLIDFFESIEQQQQPMQTQPTGYPMQQQPTGMPMQQGYGYQQPTQTGMNGFPSNGTNPYGQPQQQQQQPLQSQFTGAGFGGYTAQPQQQFQTGGAFGQDQSSFVSSPAQMQPPAQLQPQQTSSNPFRQSMMPTGAANVASNVDMAARRQSTNPFARKLSGQPTGADGGFGQQPLQPQATGTNPFARAPPPSQQQPPIPNALQVQATGSTNPFRQSMFVNQQTGQGWHNAPQATMGGLEQLETTPVFPRPGQAPMQQQQSPWG